MLVSRAAQSEVWMPAGLVSVVAMPKEPLWSKLFSNPRPKWSYTIPKPARIEVLSPSPKRVLNHPDFGRGAQANDSRGAKVW